MGSPLTRHERELLAESSEYEEWEKLKRAVVQAHAKLADAEEQLEEFEDWWSEEVRAELRSK